MVSDPELAKQISDRVRDAARLMNEVAALAQDQASREEFAVVRHAVGAVMGEMLTEILNPLYRAHPELTPAGWE